MNIIALRDCCEVLRKVVADRRRFNLDAWYTPSDDQEADTPKGYKSCGTSACAVGWCAQDEAFSTKHRLYLGRVNPVYVPNNVNVEFAETQPYAGSSRRVLTDGVLCMSPLNGYPAVCQVFSIPQELAGCFFGEGRYLPDSNYAGHRVPTRAITVLERIEWAIAAWEYLGTGDEDETILDTLGELPGGMRMEDTRACAYPNIPNAGWLLGSLRRWHAEVGEVNGQK